MPPPTRRPRSDAERNRARVLQAARDLFAERGDDVQMADVARAAEVGIGTVYRHFPTRQALVEAAALHRFAELVAFVEQECLADEPHRALGRLLAHVGEVLHRERGLSAAIEAAMGTTEPTGDTRSTLERLAADLVERGRKAETVRPDATVEDVYMIVCGLAAVVRTGSGNWRRYNEIALAGLAP